MTDAAGPTRRSALVDALRLGRARGAQLLDRGSSALQPGSKPEASLTAALDEVEARLTGAPELWSREWCTTQLRATLALCDGTLDEGAVPLRARAVAALEALAALDEREFGPLTERLATGEFTPADFLAALAARPEYEWDAFTLRLFGITSVPARSRPRVDDMVHYVPSPVRSVLELAALLGPDDVLYDLGAGLGLVTLLAAWLSSARTVGVEIEPAYHARAEARRAALGIARARLVLADAREVDLSDGTVFYVFDSFRGEILEAVLVRLSSEASGREIRVVSRGLSTAAIDGASWLERGPVSPSGLTLYRSRSR
jgi:hypothetical protein